MGTTAWINEAHVTVTDINKQKEIIGLAEELDLEHVFLVSFDDRGRLEVDIQNTWVSYSAEENIEHFIIESLRISRNVGDFIVFAQEEDQEWHVRYQVMPDGYVQHFHEVRGIYNTSPQDVYDALVNAGVDMAELVKCHNESL